MKTTIQLTSTQTEQKVITFNIPEKRIILKAISLLIITPMFAFFILLSLQNNNLFLSEILLSTSIVIILSFFRLLSKK
jgi:positive regulator of sigma E activity